MNLVDLKLKAPGMRHAHLKNSLKIAKEEGDAVTANVAIFCQ